MASSGWVCVGVALVAGLLLGSFLNVCIARLPYGESVVGPGSHCPQCMFPIRWFDNVPLLSFVWLRGRCRKCFQRIPWRYPVVEVLVAVWFCFVARGWFDAWFRAGEAGSDPLNAVVGAVGLAVMGWLLIGLAFMDWETQILPDSFTLVGTAIGFGLICVQAMFLAPGAQDIHVHSKIQISSPGSAYAHGDVFLTGPEHVVFGRLVAILAAAGVLWLMRACYRAVRGVDGLGRGDIKLMAMIAGFMGFWPAMLAMFVGIVGCGIYAVVLLAMRRANGQTRLPLGTFLACGGLVAAIAGSQLIAWYAGLL